MAKIHVLEKHVAELIAAGEVVERPSSVIKELVENSIDAGATTISVEIQRGGIAYMRVTDNGGGIAREDVPKAFLRNATSKVNQRRIWMASEPWASGERRCLYLRCQQGDLADQNRGGAGGHQLSDRGRRGACLGGCGLRKGLHNRGSGSVL